MPNDLITEFFYDGIARLIPGLLAIFLFGGYYVIRVYHQFNDATVVISICIFLAAWAIGTTIEFPSYGFVKKLIICFGVKKQFEKCQEGSKRKVFIGRILPNPDDEQELNLQCALHSVGATTRRQYYKFCAEKMMFRCLTCIFAILAVVNFVRFCTDFLYLDFCSGILNFFHLIISIILAGIFFYLYWYVLETCAGLSELIPKLAQKLKDGKIEPC